MHTAPLIRIALAGVFLSLHAAHAGETPAPALDRNGDALPPAAAARLGTVRLRHGAKLLAMAMDADGTKIATAGEDRTVRLWDGKTGRELRRFRGHAGAVRALAFSPSQDLLVSGGDDNAARIWELSTGKELAVLEGHKAPVSVLAFSKDGKSVATSGDDKIVRVWNIAYAREVARMRGHREAVRSLCFSADGKVLASATARTAVLWDAESGAQLREVLNPGDTLRFVWILPGDKGLVLGTDHYSVKVMDLWRDAEIAKFSVPDTWLNGLACSIDGSMLVTAGSDRKLRVWDPLKGTETKAVETRAASPEFLAITPDAEIAATGGPGGLLAFFNLDKARAGDAPAAGHEGAVRALACTMDGTQIASAGADGSVRLWEAASGAPLGYGAGHKARVVGVACAPDGSLVSFDTDGYVVVRDANGAEQRRFRVSQAPQHAMALAPDGKKIATGGEDEVVRVTNLADGKLAGVLEGHHGAVTALCFAPDGKTLASGSDDDSVRIWNVSEGEQTRVLEIPYGHVAGLAFSPDGATLATVAGRTAHLWTVASGVEIAKFDADAETVRAVAYSPDGEKIATGGKDGIVKLWSAAKGEALGTWRGHQGPVTALCFAPSGKTLASGSEDTSSLVWDLSVKQPEFKPEDLAPKPAAPGEQPKTATPVDDEDDGVVPDFGRNKKPEKKKPEKPPEQDNPLVPELPESLD